MATRRPHFFDAPRLTVNEQRARAARTRRSLSREGLDPVPPIEGPIASTFWGKAWCAHLDSLSDFASRLPRGRSYVRHGAVIDLRLAPGEVKARVQGTMLYDVVVTIRALPEARSRALVKACEGGVQSVIELLEGALPERMLAVVTDPERGLFPKSSEIRFRCSCPDVARMCKHVAAVLYGIGARFDRAPELLFALRGLDHHALVARATERAVDAVTAKPAFAPVLDERLVSEIFGLSMEAAVAQTAKPTARRKR